MTRQLCLILDFGSQTTQLIARRVRESKVYCEIHPCTTSFEEIRAKAPRAIILSGGPSSVYGENAPRCDPAIFDLPLPILGICYGHQLMAQALGGVVSPGEGGEYGRAHLEVIAQEHLFTGVPRAQEVWMSRGDVVQEPPPGFAVIARTDACPVAAMADVQAKRYSLQFHPEVTESVLAAWLADGGGTQALASHGIDAGGSSPRPVTRRPGPRSGPGNWSAASSLTSPPGRPPCPPAPPWR